MPTRILSRGYARLNKLLSLAGSKTVGLIDLDQVFPVQELSAVLESSEIRHARYYRNDSPAGAGANHHAINPTQSGDWDLILDEQGGAFVIPDSLTDWDFWVTDIGVSDDGAALIESITYVTDQSSAILGAAAVTNLLDDTVVISGAGELTVAQGDPYYAVQMPWRYPGLQDTTNIDLVCRVQVSGATNTQVTLMGFWIPRGVVSARG